MPVVAAAWAWYALISLSSLLRNFRNIRQSVSIIIYICKHVAFSTYNNYLSTRGALPFNAFPLSAFLAKGDLNAVIAKKCERVHVRRQPHTMKCRHGVCVELKWSERAVGWVCVRMQRGGEGEWLRGCRHVHHPNPVARELHTLSRAISVADKWMPHRGRALALCPTFDAARASYLIRPLRFSISLREFATHQFHRYFFPR